MGKATEMAVLLIDERTITTCVVTKTIIARIFFDCSVLRVGM
jgi:hypothetical protein